MTTQKSFASCEIFRTAVMLSIDNMEIDEKLRAHLLISLQIFYLEMLRKLPTDVIYPEIAN